MGPRYLPISTLTRRPERDVQGGQAAAYRLPVVRSRAATGTFGGMRGDEPGGGRDAIRYLARTSSPPEKTKTYALDPVARRVFALSGGIKRMPLSRGRRGFLFGAERLARRRQRFNALPDRAEVPQGEVSDRGADQSGSRATQRDGQAF